MKALAVLVAAIAVAPTQLPGARATQICAAAGPFWPTMTLALHRSSAWIACKEQSRIVRVATGNGKTVRSVRLGTPIIAVTTGFGSIWALGSSGTLYRLNPGSAKVVRRTALPARAPYNIWIGGGSVWVADDQGGEVLRIAPRTGKVVTRIPVSDGPADMAFNGGAAWVVNHRDRVLSRIDLATSRSRRLTVLGSSDDSAPERVAWAGGSLWITGRGTDLLQVDPSDGSIERTIEIGGSGIDVAADGDSLWVPTRSAAVDRTGFPTMDALKRVSLSSGTVSMIARPTGRVDVHGLVARRGVLWIADNTAGRLYRLR